jgi:hypothetical protein
VAPEVAPEAAVIAQETPATAAVTPAPKPSRRRPARRPKKPAVATSDVVTAAEPAREQFVEPEVPAWLEPAMPQQPATEEFAQQAKPVVEPVFEPVVAPVTEFVLEPAVATEPFAASPAKPRRRPARRPVKPVEPAVEAPAEVIVPIVPALPFEPVVPPQPEMPTPMVEAAAAEAQPEPAAKPRRRRITKPKAVEAPAAQPEPSAPELILAPVVEQVNPPVNGEAESAALAAEPPRTGVEILAVEDREGVLTYTVRDLRNNNIVRNVTRFSARHLWKYAITEREDNPLAEEQICWLGHLGLWKTYKRAGAKRYNLVQRDSSGNLHVYYGVTEDGIHGEWRGFLEGE